MQAKVMEVRAGKRRRKKEKQNKYRNFEHKDVNGGVPSFAQGLNGYKLVWVFIVGCFIGVLVETVFVWATTGVLMRRSGMLYGPFNQIYGIGAVIFTLLLYRFRNRSDLVIFFASAVIGLGFEYACSWVQEVVFGSRSWDYSNMALNVGGRINAFYGVGWGLLGLLFLTHIWPFLSEMIERIPNTIGKTLTIVCAVLLGANLLLSGLAVHRYGQRAEQVPAATAIGRFMDRYYPDAVMQEKYPSMSFKNEDTGWERPGAAPDESAPESGGESTAT